MKDNQDKFSYSYSVPTQSERDEIEEIRKKYGQKVRDTGKLQELRKLDARVRRLPKVIGILCGVVGVLMFGWGFSFIMTKNEYVWGSVIAIIGIIIFAASVFLYRVLLRRGKKKYGDRILKLSEELLDKKDEDH